jgi:hypothetical protein
MIKVWSFVGPFRLILRCLAPFGAFWVGSDPDWCWALSLISIFFIKNCRGATPKVGPLYGSSQARPSRTGDVSADVSTEYLIVLDIAPVLYIGAKMAKTRPFRDSNTRPCDLQSHALTTELKSQHSSFQKFKYIIKFMSR